MTDVEALIQRHRDAAARARDAGSELNLALHDETVELLGRLHGRVVQLESVLTDVQHMLRGPMLSKRGKNALDLLHIELAGTPHDEETGSAPGHRR